MAKRGILEHPKTLKLARKLGIKPWAAVGLLECLWHWCARYAITGEVKADPDDLADGIRYDDDSCQLFESLVSAGFFDRLPDGRVVVHDVADHADNTWKQNLKDAGLTWWNGLPPFKPKGSPLQEQSEPTQEAHKKLTSFSPQPEPEPEPIHTPPTPSRGKREKFQPPTDFECAAYAKQIGIPGKEAKTFFDHFTSNGWKVGGKAPMKDWQAAMRTWKARLEDRGKVGSGTYLDDIQEAP